MSFEFDPNIMFSLAADYISRGFKVVKLHYFRPDGSCTCPDVAHRPGGIGHAQAGKHPRFKQWQNTACDDEEVLSEWCEGSPFNLGVQLGPRSGIIDVEWDNDKAMKVAVEMGLTRIETPTFTSGRSEHRIFLWDDSLMSVGKAVHKVGGLEFRIGVGELGSQSVFPPSWHWSGAQYKWKDGFGLDDVPIAPLPREVLIHVVNDAGDVGSDSNRGKRTADLRSKMRNGAGEGDRHDFLLGVACRQVFIHPAYQNPIVQDDIVEGVHHTNLARCKPPKDRNEIAGIVSWACEIRRRREAAGDSVPVVPDDIDRLVESPEVKAMQEDARKKVEAQSRGASELSSADDSTAAKKAEASVPDVSPVTRAWALYGLVPAEKITVWEEKQENGTTIPRSKSHTHWTPGTWKIQMIQSDPPEIVLIVPNWESHPGNGKIRMPLADFLDPRVVAKRVFETTRRFILDSDPKEWHSIWRGQTAKGSGAKARPQIDGLAVMLMANKASIDDIAVGTSSLRYAVVAGWLLDAFRKATKPRDEEKPEPNESGRPCWVKPGELWFKWAKTWEDIERMHDVQIGERLKIKHMICHELRTQDLPEVRHTFGGIRHSYVVFDEKWYAAVERLASGRRAESDDAIIGGNPPEINNEVGQENDVTAST